MTADPPSSRRGLGDRGERAALACLRAKGYSIVACNHRTRIGEVDIIARDGPVTVFVEVKVRATVDAALEAVDTRKQRKLSALATAYLLENGGTERPARFDVVAVCARDLACTHVENAFDCRLE